MKNNKTVPAPEALYTFLFYHPEQGTVDEVNIQAPELKLAIHKIIFNHAAMIECNSDACDEEEYFDYAQSLIIGNDRDDLIQDYGSSTDYRLVAIHIRPLNHDYIIVMGFNPETSTINIRVGQPDEPVVDSQFIKELDDIKSFYEFNLMVSTTIRRVYRDVFKQECPPLTKPPLGIQTRKFWLEMRLKELRRSIISYPTSGFAPKGDWIVEEEILTVELEKYEN